MPFRVGACAGLALILTGCGPIDQMLRAPNAPVIVRFEVWNRTLDPVFLIDADGRLLSVEACGHALADQFRVNEVKVRMDAGYVFGFGSGGLNGASQYLVIVEADGESFPAERRPVALPACLGHPHVQPGV